MELSQSVHRKQEETRAEDSAIMLFGKQIKNLSNAEKIKEELSPRGVDEKGLSFATSSDDDEDLYPACEENVHVMHSTSAPMGSVSASEAASKEHAKKRKAIESGCAIQDMDAEKPNSITTEHGIMASMGGDDNHAGKSKGSMWSRCPRCNSADTKFCYFNNYNVNQPRHFCKHCQRYWTAGGTLRNVPIGAGKRKNKHTLHKHGFVANSASTLSVSTSSMVPMGVSDNPDFSLPIVKSDPLPTPESSLLSAVKSDQINTNLELSAHHLFTPSMMSPLPPGNIVHPHSTNKLITLHQLHENLQSTLSQIHHPHEYSKLGPICPNLACGPSLMNPINPKLASGGCCNLSQGPPDVQRLSQISPFPHNGLPGSSQTCPHWHSGFPGLSQICPDLRSVPPELSRMCPHLQSGFCRMCYKCPHVPSGSCKASHECPDYALPLKSERDFSEIDEAKSRLESELPMSDQKSASLERGLLDTARTASSERSNESCLQVGHPEADPKEVYKCMQRFNEMKPIGCSALAECKAHTRGVCQGAIDMKAAAPMCVQGDEGKNPSNSASMIKAEEASNIGNLMTRGVGEGYNNLLNIWGALWPCFYNMFWLDPLAFTHSKPMLTPQGWALPFMPPSAPKVEPTSCSANNSRSPNTCASTNFDPSSTLTASNTPITLVTPFEDIYHHACNIDKPRQENAL